nr:transposase [Sinorhizobium medicae]
MPAKGINSISVVAHEAISPATGSPGTATLSTAYERPRLGTIEDARGRKDELFKVLERPGIPLHTNASEHDLRSFVTRRKISGGTMSRDGRVARDTMRRLMKTCRKLGLSFWSYLGDRIGLEGQAIPPLATLVATKA